ncbi:MAG: GntR family transcriptional regulator [Lautropia sp.]
MRPRPAGHDRPPAGRHGFRPKPGPIPLYYQIEQDLRRRIESAEFKPNDPLPSEHRLSREYAVSRVTLRRALDALLDSRLIAKRRGVGAFVSQAPAAGKSVTLVGRLDDAFLYSDQLSYRVLSRKRVQPPEAVAAAMRLQGPVDCLEVVALTKGEPFAYSRFHFPLEVGAQLTTEMLGGTVPILRVVEAALGEAVSWAEQTLEPVLASARIAGSLGIRPRAPILRARRTYYTAAGWAVESAVVHYHPERYAYSVQLLA